MKNIKQILLYFVLTGVLLLTGYSVFEIEQSVTFFLSDPQKYYDVLFIDPPVYIFALIYLVLILSVFIILESKFKKGILTLLLIPVIIFLFGKISALIAVLTFLTAGFAVGSYLNKLFPKSELTATKFGVSVYFGICLNSFLIWLVMHIKINYFAYYYLFFLLEILIFHKYLLTELSKFRINLPELKLSWGQKAIIISFVFFVFYPLVSYYQWDELVNHLYIPKYTSLHGLFHFSPLYPAVLDQSIIPKAAYTAVYILGGNLGEFAIRLINYLIIYLTFFLLESFTRKRFGQRIAFIATLVAISTPFIAGDLGLIFIDSFAFLASVVLFFHFLNTYDDLKFKNIISFFILIPLTYFTKQQSLFIIIPAGFLLTAKIIQESLKKRNSVRINSLIIGGVLAFILFLPPLVHNYAITGNPLFPYSNKFFKSPWFSTTGFLSGPYTRMPAITGFKDVLKTMSWWHLTFNSFDQRFYFWMNRFSFGITFFIFFIFSPFIFFFEADREKRKLMAVIYFIFILSVILWLYILTGPQMRYFITILPMGSIVIAYTINMIYDRLKNVNVRYFVFIPVLAIIITANFVFQLSSVKYPYPLSGLLTDKNINSEVKYWQEVKKVFDYANRNYGMNSKGFLSYSPALYFADFNIEVDDWYNYKLNQKLALADTASAKFNLLFKEEKFDFLILTNDSSYSKIFNTPPNDKMLIKEITSQGYTFYKPNREYLN